MTNDSQEITPFKAYNLRDTAKLLGYHPQTLHELLASNNQVVMNMNPVKVGKEWRFLGENILGALGSATYPQINKSPMFTAGVATEIINNNEGDA